MKLQFTVSVYWLVGSESNACEWNDKLGFDSHQVKRKSMKIDIGSFPAWHSGQLGI